MKTYEGGGRIEVNGQPIDNGCAAAPPATKSGDVLIFAPQAKLEEVLRVDHDLIDAHGSRTATSFYAKNGTLLATADRTGDSRKHQARSEMAMKLAKSEEHVKQLSEKLYGVPGVADDIGYLGREVGLDDEVQRLERQLRRLRRAYGLPKPKKRAR